MLFGVGHVKGERAISRAKNMSPQAVFYFAIYKPECWGLLKREVATRYPELRLAFSRPGFATFKGPPQVAFAPWLALASGTSLGKAQLVDGQVQLGDWGDVSVAERTRFHWHFDPEQEAWRGEEHNPLIGAAAAAPSVHVITLDRTVGAEAWLGLSEQRTLGRFVGAPVVPPEHAPSRAYAKIVEVCAHLGIAWSPGAVVLELGAAPGGATLALLEQGMHVVAVDPGEMDKAVPGWATQRGVLYRRVQKKASNLDRADLTGLPGAPSWLLCDINLAPPVALTQLLHAYGQVKRSVRTLVWTCKINDDKALETVPGVLRRLGELTQGSAQVVHLPSHRREFAVVIERA